ncbi:putative short-chain dehydrogenase/reductase family protein [Cadophora sp. MPI-SDFR-AT-0126]|nr:putative short-chain dehydrogenase/reductase family protein [Leotiomycetes sp. MPI-SDFR-AT-0126]
MSSASLEMPPFQKPPFAGFFPKHGVPEIIRQAQKIDLSGQVAIISGANSGLGFHAAKHLLGLKLSHLILAVRSKEKGKEAAANLQKQFSSARIDVWDLDMLSYESIQAFVRRIEKHLDRLDIIILNSGIAHSTFTICPGTGHCEDIQVNYLSTFLLAILVLQTLKKMKTTRSPTLSTPRMTIVNSGTALAAKFPNRNERRLLASFDDSQVQPFDTLERYSVSKLLGHLFFVRLLKCLDPEDAIVNLIQPGLCKGTRLFREAPLVMTVIFSVVKFFTALTVEEGAWLYVDAVVLRGKESHGCFVSEGKIQPFASLASSEEGSKTVDALWGETMTEFEFAGIREMLQSEVQS